MHVLQRYVYQADLKWLIGVVLNWDGFMLGSVVISETNKYDKKAKKWDPERSPQSPGEGDAVAQKRTLRTPPLLGPHTPSPPAPPLKWFNEVPYIQVPPPDEEEGESATKQEKAKPTVECDWVNLMQDLGLEDA